MTPNNREELIEVCAMAEAERLCYGGWGSWGNMPRDIQHAFTEPVRQTFLALDTAGIALVPKVAMEGMVDAGFLADGMADDVRASYTAMLSASPYISSALPHLTKSAEQHGGNND